MKKVAEDLRYLLRRGYRKEPALRFLANRWQLDRIEREILKRGVFAPQEAQRRRAKLGPLALISQESLYLDGHNVLITIESGILGHPVFLADDGVVRDARCLSRRFRARDSTFEALEALLTLFQEVPPKEIIFFLDRPLSGSGELAKEIRQRLQNQGIKGKVLLLEAADQALKKGFPLLASADAPLMESASQVVDLAAEALKRLRCPFFDLTNNASHLENG